jgi:hypothetical protein
MQFAIYDDETSHGAGRPARQKMHELASLALELTIHHYGFDLFFRDLLEDSIRDTCQEIASQAP